MNYVLLLFVSSVSLFNILVFKYVLKVRKKILNWKEEDEKELARIEYIKRTQLGITKEVV